MGWGYGVIGGKEVGYTVEAKCEHPGCDEDIDRGLSYACGDEHGDTEQGCSGYFCEKHRSNQFEVRPGRIVNICDECARIILRDNDDMWEDPEEGVICKKPDRVDEDEEEVDPEKV